MTSRPKLSWEWNGQIQKTDGPEPRLFANPSSGGNDYLVQNGTKAKLNPSSTPGRNTADLAQRHSLPTSRDASIVFTGPRGNGKSSLAIIAGLLLRRRVIDADDHFTTKIGSSTSFKRKYGAEKHLSEQLESTKALLTRYDKNCVISCGPYVMAEQFRAFMKEYRRTHPIIYVIRPEDDVADYLGVKEKGKLQQWMDNVHTTYLGISNIEFFNLPELWKETSERCPAEELLGSVLHGRLIMHKKVQTLQKTQTALARFLTAAIGHKAPSLSHTVFPTLNPTLPEHRIYSNVVSIPISSLIREDVDISQISAGADAVELVLDSLDTPCKSTVTSGALSRFVAEIRYFHAVPVIYHVEMAKMKPVDWKLYCDLLHQGLRSAPEYLTVDLDASDSEIQLLSFKSGPTKLIGHQNNAAAGAQYWESSEPFKQYKRAADLGCDIVRLVKPCYTMAENFSCMAFVSKINRMPHHIPIIAYNTGNIGHISLVCNPILSPVLHAPRRQTPSSRSEPNIHSPASLTISERWSTLFMLHALESLKFFVIGSSVKNSLSPAMHNAAFHALGMPHVYSIHETDSLEVMRTLFTDPNFGGASVSLPFKTRVLSLVEKQSAASKLIGGSNTILPLRHLPDHKDPSDPRQKNQRHRAGPIAMLYADNTDWMGICACVSRSISPANSVNPETAALVIGAGGMARAAIYCLVHLGVRNICIFNRTVSHAQALATHFEAMFVNFLDGKDKSPHALGNSQESLRIKVLDSLSASWPEGFCQPNIVICAIKAYDHQNPTTPPFTMPLSWMKNPTGGIIVESAYHTPETPLMRQMRRENHLGWTVIDPIEVFFEQACAQWELFTGSRAPRGVMWEACLNEYANKMKNNDYGSMQTADI